MPRMRLSYVGQVTRMLWLGFEETAFAALTELTCDTRPPNIRVAALTEIGRWHATFGRQDEAIAAVEHAISLMSSEALPDEARALAIDLLTPIGRRDQVHRLLADAPEPFREGADGVLRRANALVSFQPGNLSTQHAALELINSLFTSRGCTGIEFIDPGAGMALDNVRGTAQPGPTTSGPLVSVIMPAWNAADTIHFALRGLLEQTWTALEIIVVDDGSTDGTREIVAAYDDPRIRLEQNVGKGTYAARNFGLSRARGEFVTVHDADDWSHPEKVEQQVVPLLDNDSLVGSQSACARTSPALYFVEPSLRPRRAKVIPNTSSFLIRRMAFDALGPWDTPSVSADNELIERCARFYGTSAVTSVLRDVPLSFALRGPSSLTSASVGTGVLSLQHIAGARRLYRHEYVRWHRRGDFVASLPLDPDRTARPFVRPRLLEAERSAQPDQFDVVIMGDFALGATSLRSTVQEVAAQRDAGLRTGLLYVPEYRAEFDRYRRPNELPLGPVDERLLDLVDGERVRLLAAGEEISADILIVRPPQILQEPIVGLPVIHSGATVVVVDGLPHSDVGDSASNYEPRRCSDTLSGLGHQRVVWSPAGPTVRSAITNRPAFAGLEVATEDWRDVIDTREWTRPSRPPWAHNRPIRIGRHSEDRPRRWPETASGILAAYPDDPAFEVKVLGGVLTAHAIIGSIPRNWRVDDRADLRTFLAGLDVYVYYPHSLHTPASGRAILEALAVGVPVVAHPMFEPLFGSAIVCGAPSDVVDNVQRLMADPDLYEEHVRRGQALVRDEFGPERHLNRVATFAAMSERTGYGDPK